MTTYNNSHYQAHLLADLITIPLMYNQSCTQEKIFNKKKKKKEQQNYPPYFSFTCPYFALMPKM